MQNIIKAILVWGLILAVCHGLCGCKGGMTPELGGINGPDAIDEYENVEFWVSLTNASDATYLWSCDPVDAGKFDNPDRPKTGFTASMVTQDTPVKINVIVESQQFSPVILSRNITIRDTGWTRTWGGDNSDYGNGVAVDASGNAYVTGGFHDIVDFDPGPGVDEHTSNGYYDIFLGKFDSNGESQWARTWGGSWDDYGRGVAVDASGNTYVTGSFKGVIDFDPSPGVDEHTSNSYEDIFLSKFNSNGEFQWARTWGGAMDDYGYGVAVDASGNIYVTGRFLYIADLDPGPGVDEHITNGLDDIFLSKFDSNGEFQWARSWGGNSRDIGHDVTIDESGSIYVTGFFLFTVDFDPGPGVIEYQSNGLGDIFLSKFNSNGEFQWANTWGGEGIDSGRGIAIDASGNAYVSGYFEDIVDFDSGPGMDEHKSSGKCDSFLIKFDLNGEFQWTNTWGGEGEDTGSGVATDESGDIYTVGRFQETVDFDPGPGVDEHTANGIGYDIFLNMFDSDGGFQRARTWGGTGVFESGNGVAIDVSGNVYTVGVFQKTVDFVPGHGVDEQTSHGDTDVFLCRFPPDWDW